MRKMIKHIRKVVAVCGSIGVVPCKCSRKIPKNLLN